jgi:hypothetical protein
MDATPPGCETSSQLLRRGVRRLDSIAMQSMEAVGTVLYRAKVSVLVNTQPCSPQRHSMSMHHSVRKRAVNVPARGGQLISNAQGTQQSHPAG